MLHFTPVVVAHGPFSTMAAVVEVDLAKLLCNLQRIYKHAQVCFSAIHAMVYVGLSVRSKPISVHREALVELCV